MIQILSNKPLLVRPVCVLLSFNHVQSICCILITIFYHQVHGKRTNVFVDTSLQEILGIDDESNNNNQCTFTEDSATMVTKSVSIYNMINVQDETISIRVVYSTGLAWIAFGFSSSLQVPLLSSSWIVPSTPIIGLPEENTVCQYNITGYSVDTIQRFDHTEGTSPVTNQLVYQIIDDTTDFGSIATVLEFTMPLRVAFPDIALTTDIESAITPQSSQFTWAIGKSNKFSDMHSMTGTNHFESMNFCPNQNLLTIPPPPLYLPTNQPLSLTSSPISMSPVFPPTTNVTTGVETTTLTQEVMMTLSPSVLPTTMILSPLFPPTTMISSPSFPPTKMISSTSFLPTTLKIKPTLFPTKRMTSNPSRLTAKITTVPSSVPRKISIPTSQPTEMITSVPTRPLTKVATSIPTSPPTMAATSIPTSPPTKVNTSIPTRPPTKVTTFIPTRPPIKVTTFIPTRSPTKTTSIPTQMPKTKTTLFPTNNPTQQMVTAINNTTQKDCSYPIQSQRLSLSGEDDTVDITNIVNQEEQTMRIKMTYNQKGYIAFGFNKSPFMVPATVIIGLPGSTTGSTGTSNVIGMYSITGTSVSEIKPIPIEQQDAIFLDTVVLAQSDSSTTTTMEITLSLAVQYSADVGTLVTDPTNALSKQNRFIWSAGFDNELKFHKHRGSDILQLNYC